MMYFFENLLGKYFFSIVIQNLIQIHQKLKETINQ